MSATAPDQDHVTYDREIRDLYRERNTRRFTTPLYPTGPRRPFGELLLIVIVAALVSAGMATLIVSLLPPADSVPVIQREVAVALPTQLLDDVAARVRGATVSIFAQRTSKSALELERAYLARETLGQGLVLSSDGWVVTTSAVVRDLRASYTALAADGTMHTVEAVVQDPVAPLVYMKLPADHLLATPFAEYTELNSGVSLVAASYVTQSPVPALYQRRLAHRSARSVTARADFPVSSETFPDRYLLDLALPAGSAGAPVFTTQGKAVGLITEFDGALQGVIPLDNLHSIIDNLFADGQVVRPTLGVSYVQGSWLTPFGAQPSGVTGALVTGSSRRSALVAGGPAAAAGVREGDRIISLGTERLDERSLSAILQQYRPGARVELELERGGKAQTATVTLGSVKSTARP